MAELLGKALAGVFEQWAEEIRARADEAEAALNRGADASREEECLRPRAVSAGGNSDRKGNGKGAGDLGAPAKLVGSEQFWLAIRSQLTGRFSAGMTTTAMRQAADIAQLRPRRAAASLILVVDRKGGH